VSQVGSVFAVKPQHSSPAPCLGGRGPRTAIRLIREKAQGTRASFPSPLQGNGSLVARYEWAVQRGRYMTLETIAPLSHTKVSGCLPWRPDQPGKADEIGDQHWHVTSRCGTGSTPPCRSVASTNSNERRFRASTGSTCATGSPETPIRGQTYVTVN